MSCNQTNNNLKTSKINIMNKDIQNLQTEFTSVKPVIDFTKVVDMPEFFYIFQQSKKVTFDVSYRRLGRNQYQNFTSSAQEFNQPKTDYSRCGQCQDDILKGLALQFYKKWDILHLSPVTPEIYNELLADLEELKLKYNFIHSDTDNLGFSKDKALSKLTPKN